MHPTHNPTTFPKGFGYNGPGVKDVRDYRYGAQLVPQLLPAAVDLFPYVTHMWSQNGGSCVGHGCWGAFALLQNITKAADTSLLSPMFIYDWARMKDGSFPSDVGTYISSGMYVMAHQGVASNAMWPGESSPSVPPTSAADTEALDHKILTYLSLSSYTGQALIDAIKQNLATGYPVVGGHTVYHSFDGYSDNIVPMPSNSDTVWGGHAWYYVGYDDNFATPYGPGVYICVNSWGTSGQRFYLPYAYVPKYGDDFWTIRTETNPGGATASVTTLVDSPNPSTVGDSISLTATVTGNQPTGSVNFAADGVTLGSAAVTAGASKFSTNTLVAGTHNMTASYVGDSLNQPSTSAPVSQVVQGVAPSPSVDTTPPKVVITSPLNGSVFTRHGTTGVTAIATDDVAMGTLSMILDGITMVTSTSADVAIVSSTFRWNLNKAAKGQHTITVIATDAAGNKSSASVTVTVR